MLFTVRIWSAFTYETRPVNGTALILVELTLMKAAALQLVGIAKTVYSGPPGQPLNKAAALLIATSFPVTEASRYTNGYCTFLKLTF